MLRGYVKIWRKSLDSGLIKNHKLWSFWTWCLLKASHKPIKQMVGMQMIELQPGQFVFGRKKAAEELGLSEQNIRTFTSFLKKSKNLTIKPTNKFSIVSIVNWDTYQEDGGGINQQSNQHLTSSQPAANHKQTHKHINNNPPTPQRGKVLELKKYLLENIPPEISFLESKIVSFFEYRQQKPKAKRYQSPVGINGLFRDLNNCLAAGYDLSVCLDIAMERGWQTPSVDYFKPEMFPKNGKAFLRVIEETPEEIAREIAEKMS